MATNTSTSVPAWTYSQATGQLFDVSGLVVSRGYSGKARGRNNPALEGVAGIGPIPTGLWRMQSIYNSGSVGPRAIVLWAEDGTPDDHEARTGRSGFRVHGDKVGAPGMASRGCIILPRAVRELLWRSPVRHIRVVT